MIHNFSKSNSIISHYLAELRDCEIQSNPQRFRFNLKRLASAMGYEISKGLTYTDKLVTTPLGESDSKVLDCKIVLATILRAGLPMHDGLLEVFDCAESAFIAAYRQHHKDGTFEINKEYVTCPDLSGKALILSDPMLATGSSFAKSLESLEEHGQPGEIHIVSVIASEYGVNHLNRLYPHVHIWVAAIDEELTAKSYIVPGLGDAGDLAFGEKLQA
ncbi:MAG: uracil phosphoribosyltransferase [Saprospiraceae bacterium]